MAETNSTAQRQQKPSPRTKQHSPREAVLQFVGYLLQSLTLILGAALDVVPFGHGAVHQRFNSLGDGFGVSKLGLNLLGSLVGKFGMIFHDGFHLRLLLLGVGEKIFQHHLGLSLVFGQMLFQPFPAVGDGARDTGCRT